MSSTERAAANYLRESRAAIDALDEALLRILAQRARIVSSLWESKLSVGLPIRDEQREAEVTRRLEEWAEEMGRGFLDPAAVGRIWRAIMSVTVEP